MPYPPTTPTVLLCQALAAAVRAAWNPPAPSAADWHYFKRFGDADDVSVPALQGRQVVFFPTHYEWENGTRGQDRYTHQVSCLVAERYADASGDPPRDWTSERVDFVHTQIVQFTRYTRTGPPAFNPFVMTLGGRVEVLDVKKLVTGGKLFYSLVELEFEELVTP